MTASSPAVLKAANDIYNAGVALRNCSGLTITDFTEYLGPALRALNSVVVSKTQQAKAPICPDEGHSDLEVDPTEGMADRG